MNLSNDKNLENGLEVSNNKTIINNNSSVNSTDIDVNIKDIEEVNFDNIFTNEDNIKGFDVTKEELDSVAQLNDIYDSDIEVI